MVRNGTIIFLLVLSAWAGVGHGATNLAKVPGGTFEPLFKSSIGEKSSSTVRVESFLLETYPVTDAEFALFVAANSKWQKDQAAAIFVDGRYLKHWSKDQALAASRQPLVNVSWHAAKAYCAWLGRRLPTDLEWQFAAYEGSDDYTARLAEWYSKPASDSLPEVPSGKANRFGLYNMYGPVWEWVLDFSSLMVTDDGRATAGADSSTFCGAGAQSATESRNYIGFMRAAYLSALKANYTTGSLGFRCAQSLSEIKK